MSYSRTKDLAKQYAKLDEIRKAYLSGLMDGLAMKHDSRPQDAGIRQQAPDRKAVAAGPAAIR